MAEPIISDVVSKILANLGSKAYKKLMFAKDLDPHIERLQQLKTTAEATLRDATLLEACTNAQQDAFEKISSALADLDDFLDEHAIKAELKQVMRGNKLIKSVRSFFSETNHLVSAMKDARKLKAIMENFDCIATNHRNIGSIVSSPCAAATNCRNVQMASSPILNSLVIGRDKDRNNIISMLSEDSMATKSLSVASIVGIGGMGKTTLAWYVYNDEGVERCFDVKFWVQTGPQGVDFIKVLENIVGCVADPCNINQLYHHFCRAIGGKKFLLVLDNVWDQGDLRGKWLDFRGLVNIGASGSKVLITTRDQKVAAVMDSDARFMLKDLTKDDSWHLFQKIAFTQWHEPGVEAIGREIAEMCPNVPLVIRSIGGLLAGKRTVQEWQAFRDDQLANFTSYGRDIMQTLKLSYDRLDARLKDCVTYCTLFPKREPLGKYDMIHRWMALGYIVPKYSNQSLEEAGEEYVIKLVDCGFLNLSSNPFFFYMQDVMYELVHSLAGPKYKVADSSTNEFDERVRHVSTWNVERDYWEVPSSLFKIKRLKSFITGFDPRFATKVKCWSICNKYILKFQFLNVLDLQGMVIQDLPASVGELICLRYLGLSSTNVVKLPTSITRLVNLQSLYLRDCHKLEELPSDISKLESLRHLSLERGNKLSHMPMGLGNLTDLRTLDVFVVGEKIGCGGKLADLDGLDNLSGWLSIEVLRESKDIASSEIGGVNLHMKEKLKTLCIKFMNGTKEDERVLEYLLPPTSLQQLLISGYGGERLPSWMTDQLESHLPNLVDIYLGVCKACRNLCSLGRLPHLKFLTFKGLDEVEYIEDSGNGNPIDELPRVPLFPSLEILFVYNMPNLKGWWSSGEQDSRKPLQVQHHQDHVVNWKPAFPKLKELFVDSLELAIGIARQHLGGFTSLDYLNIDYNINMLHDVNIRYSIGLRHQHRQPLTLLKCCLPKLLKLKYTGINDVEVLPEAFRDLSSLTYLYIGWCRELKAVPEWIDTLTSLEYLCFHYCPKMESLPHQFENLRNLKKFSVSGCPILSEKCRPNGEYWPLIQHIPHLSIK